MANRNETTPDQVTINAPGFTKATRGRDTSRATAERLERDGSATTQRERVYRFVSLEGARGATSKEIAFAIGSVSNRVASRLCELRERGKIVTFNEKRDGAYVNCSRERWDGDPMKLARVTGNPNMESERCPTCGRPEQFERYIDND